jgi:hypothetical protein
MVFIHPVILRDHLNASVYTKEKYSAIKNKQQNSKILRRGAFKNRAEAFPPLKKVITTPGKAQRELQQQRAKQAAAKKRRAVVRKSVAVPKNTAPESIEAIPVIDDY